MERYHTDPFLFDTDGDGIGDGQEVLLSLNPLSGTTHSGIPDAEYSVKQQIKEEVFREVNTEESPYQFTADITAAGDVNQNIKAEISRYATGLSDNRAILGKPVELHYSLEEIKEAEIQFCIKEEYTKNEGSSYAASTPELSGIRRFTIFKYEEESGLLLPVLTEYDEKTNTIQTSDNKLGTYCVVDLEKWLYDLGIAPIAKKASRTAPASAAVSKSEEELELDRLEDSGELPAGYVPVTLEELEKEISHTLPNPGRRAALVNQPVDIVLVVDATRSMADTINLTKTYLVRMIAGLYEEGITPYISVVSYSDYITHKEDGAKVIKKKDGTIWANTQKDAAELLSGIEIVGGKNETPIDALEMGRRLNFRSGAAKFVVLLTNEDYCIENRYGIKTIQELAGLLKADRKMTAVITKPSWKDTYQPLISATGGEWFPIYSDYSSDLTAFILSKLKSQKGYTVVNGASMQTVTLKETLKKGGAADTDQDGLTDSEESNWDLISVSGSKITLPTLQDCIRKQTGVQKTALDRLGTVYGTKLKELRILPVDSDPTSADTDQDGCPDKEDENPFDSSTGEVWLKFELDHNIVYLKQGKKDHYYEKMLLCEEGSTKAAVYLYEEGEWNDTGKTEPLPDAGKQARTSIRIKRILPFAKEFDAKLQEMKKVIKKQFIIMGYDIDDMTKQDWNLVYTGAGAGLIDASLEEISVWQRVFELNVFDLWNGYHLARALRPSSSQLKSVFLKINGKKESDLLKEYYYLRAKADAEFIVYFAAKTIEKGSTAAAMAAAAAGGAAAGIASTTAAGGAALALTTGGTTLIVPAASATVVAASAAGAGLLSISAKYAGNIADNALSHSKADLERLGKVSGGTTVIKTGDRTPNGREFSKHAAEQASKRKYSPEDIDDIINNWTEKGYQPGGKTIYVKKQSYGRDIVVIDKNGKSIVSVIGGNGKKGVPNTLQSMDDVKQMMKNQGGYYTIPMY